jgi:hypothetical protein
MGGFEDALEMIPMIIKFIITLPQRFGNILTGLLNIFFGVAVALKDVGVISGIVFIDFFILMMYSWEFVRTYTICGVQFAGNITNCIFYYIIDIIVNFLTLLFVHLPLWLLLNFLGINLYKEMQKMYDMLEKLDQIILNYVGFHIIHWPKNVRDKCYNCKRLKMSVYAGKIMGLVDDFTIKIPAIIIKSIPYLKGALNNLMQIFSSNPEMPNPLVPRSPF